MALMSSAVTQSDDLSIELQEFMDNVLAPSLGVDSKEQ